MQDKKMWTYPELRYVTVNQFKMDYTQLAFEVNKKFHGGADVRTANDVQRIGKSKNIFNKDKDRRLV
jgi:hypothetical protein